MKKSRRPLVSAKERGCVLCGSFNNVQRAHYTGIDQHRLGKGLATKCDHLFTADLCIDCHQRFDQPKERKSLDLDSEMKLAILLTIKRDLDQGVMEYTGKGLQK